MIEEFKEYVDKTYSSHYGANARNLQSAEVISERGRGMDFFLGNIDKYNDRYGKKGGRGARCQERGHHGFSLLMALPLVTIV